MVTRRQFSGIAFIISLVIAPVPGPSSRTVFVFNNFANETIFFAKKREDGAMAPVCLADLMSCLRKIIGDIRQSRLDRDGSGFFSKRKGNYGISHCSCKWVMVTSLWNNIKSHHREVKYV